MKDSQNDSKRDSAIKNEDIKQFQPILESSFLSKAQSIYPEYMRQYLRFRTRNGPQCPFCFSAAKHIYLSEISRKGVDFLSRLQSNNWTDYD